MSVARHHAEWLSLIEVSGPFLSMLVLMRVFPQGLDQRDPEKAKELRLAYDEWQDNPESPGRHRAWVDFVLNRLLEFPGSTIAEGQAIHSGLQALMVEYGETLRPDLAITAPAGQSDPGAARLLVQIYPPDQNLDSPVAGKHWKASPATRMTELLHASDVPLGITTNGEQWMLVFAPRGETSGFASWYASLWHEEPITLRAFHSLLHVRHFFGVTEADTLCALLKESAQDQQEVTIQLGLQVRCAVEVLVQAFDRLDLDSGRRLLSGMSTKTLYEGALTVMMRLVFLFSAEERGLIRLGEPLYDDNYAVSTLREWLRETADQQGEEVLERRFDAWARLLAAFRAVHGGVTHESLRLPAYGGSVFDPDRYPFLEGRAPGSNWREAPAEPLAVNNRVVLHLLESLQLLQVKVLGGGPAEARRLSFRTLDIEQIGHVYEGLLDHTAVRATTTILGLQGTKSKEPEIPLEKLEELLAQGEDELIDFLHEETKRSDAALHRALREPELVSNAHKLLIACGQDTVLRDRILPFTGLIREDSFQMPVVVRTGSVYVTEGTTRRSTGTHYTPRSFTEPIVLHTLEPLVYQGPVEGWPKEQWRLKSPREILALRVCDMTMGSGAFLVQACRYLAERLVEAWEIAEKCQPGAFIVTPEGDVSTGAATERLLPKDPAERLAIARRFVVDRSLFGVDINPMAVEMAKLSLWLVTAQHNRPFTFLDHALKCGDSLLGICRFKQLETFRLDDAEATQVLILSNYDELIRAAIAKRRELEALPSNEAAQIAAKEALNAESEERLSHLKLASDLLIAAALTEGTDQQKELAHVDAHLKVSEYISKPLQEFRQFVHERLDGRCPFHWPLEFPEVFEHGGFHTFIGNPPFKAGRFLSKDLGRDYLKYLQSPPYCLRGQSDYCAAFASRGFALCCRNGIAGLITTKTISEGDTRGAFLNAALRDGGRLIWVASLVWWPGDAQVVVSLMVIERSRSKVQPLLDGLALPEIDATFSPVEMVRDEPKELTTSSRLVAKGVGLGSDSFVLENLEGVRLNEMDSLHVRRYVGGVEHNSAPDGWGGRFVFYFQNITDEETLRNLPVARAFLERVVKTDRVREYWRYRRSGDGMFALLRETRFCIIRAQTSSTWTFSYWSREDIFDQSVIVFGSNCEGLWSVLNSSIHEAWATKYGRLMKTDTAYAPSDSFNNFPLPYDPIAQSDVTLAEIARRLSAVRQTAEQGQGGKTKVYGRLQDPGEKSADILRLRALHMDMDQAVATAYGWSDLDLGHGFHETKQGLRYTLSEPARRTVLDRLLALNHQRYEEELKAGLYDNKGKTKGTGGKRGRKPKSPSSNPMPTLLE